MKKTHTIFTAATLCFVMAMFVLVNDRPATATIQACADMSVDVGQSVTCNIDVENTTSNDLMALKANVSVANSVDLSSTDSNWTCSTVSGGINCSRELSSALAPGDSEVLTISFVANAAGNIGFSVDMSGSETTTVTTTSVSYTGYGYATIVDSGIYAEAVDDMFFGGSDIVTDNVASNDTLCTIGTTTFSAHDLSGGTITAGIDNTGEFTFQFPISSYNETFQYDILCDGTVVDTATVDISYMPG